MIQWPSIKEIVDYPIPGKEQFYSYKSNIDYKLFESNGRYLYIKLDFIDMSVYVSTNSQNLSRDECEFLKAYFSNFNFILASNYGPTTAKLSKPAVIQSNTDIIKYEYVIL